MFDMSFKKSEMRLSHKRNLSDEGVATMGTDRACYNFIKTSRGSLDLPWNGQEAAVPVCLL
jgi:hypothetical protein